MRMATFSRRQFPVRRHFRPGVVDRADDQAFIRFARHDRRSGFTALENRFERVQPKTAFLLLHGVTRIALLSQQRPDILLEKLLTCSRTGRVRVAGLSSRYAQRADHN